MPALEFAMPPGDVTRLLRLPALARRASRPVTVERIWHDTADGALDHAALSLGVQKGQWRLERSRPGAGAPWPPGTPAPMVAEAATPDALGHALPHALHHVLPGPLMPLAGFYGKQREATVGEGDATVHVLLLQGTLRGVTQEQPVCRLTLTGPPAAVASLAAQLGRSVALTVPRCSLAAEAIALARGRPATPRQTGAPAVPPGMTLGDAMALIFGHLTDVILAGALLAGEGSTPEPVHQMRVAVRRLRSALSLFRRAVDPAAFDSVKPGLRDLAATLGAARDWDVFLAGTGHLVHVAMDGDRRISAMLAAGERRRVAAYGVLRQNLQGAEFRALELALAELCTLRPWQETASEEQAAALAEPACIYAARLLDRSLEHMLAPGADLSGLEVEALHTIRKKGKRLRYAAEFFTPLYPARNRQRAAKRFIGRLCSLQEALGHLNDTASAGALMAALGGGADRQFAAGAVQGFVAARQGDTHAQIGHAWSRFRRQDGFWA